MVKKIEVISSKYLTTNLQLKNFIQSYHGIVKRFFFVFLRHRNRHYINNLEKLNSRDLRDNLNEINHIHFKCVVIFRACQI